MPNPQIQIIAWSELYHRMETLPKLAAENLRVGDPTLKRLACLSDVANRVNAGIWSATPFESRPKPYGVHEFMLLLDGALCIVAEDGSEVQVRAPNMLVIPKGLPCSWRQSEPVHKIYMTFAGNAVESAEKGELRAVPMNDATVAQAIVTPSHGAPNGRRIIFSDPSGHFQVGVSTCEVCTATPYDLHLHELVHLLSGQITLTETSGQSHQLIAGQTVLMQRGTPVSLSCQSSARMVFCAYAP
jgi:uncharacterized cupin superfamily protein